MSSSGMGGINGDLSRLGPLCLRPALLVEARALDQRPLARRRSAAPAVEVGFAMPRVLPWARPARQWLFPPVHVRGLARPAAKVYRRTWTVPIINHNVMAGDLRLSAWAPPHACIKGRPYCDR